jgi:hypothetical protein
MMFTHSMSSVLIVFILNGYILELFAAKKLLRPSLITLLQVANVVASVVVPSTLLWVLEPNPGTPFAFLSSPFFEYNRNFVC